MEPPITLKEVAEMYGVTPSQVRYALKSGYIRGYKMGWVWVFYKEDLPDEWPVRRYRKREPEPVL